MATADGWTYGGYSYKYVDGNPPDEYRCHICRLVARDPQQVTCCYNIYCKSCLDILKRKGRGFICPTCRSSLEGKYFKDGRVERGIKSLKVYCTNTDSGCQWMGTINDIDAHLETCPKAIIPCEYNTVGCDKGMKREEQEKHNEESITAHLQLTKEQLEVTNDQLELKNEQLQTTNEHLQLTEQQLKVAIKTIQSLKARLQEHENLLTTSTE
ncbi:PREDICTED: TNF receptor-associated factor 4-like, partial [Amphimedon queenslandica]|uniref:RING-type domain-containing protein n=1 Tax=Amphimedon queenslandica TaxID=400682 RepID=A0A1X7T9Q2_AMPQE